MLGQEDANPKVWIDISGVQATLNKTNEALRSLQRAIALGGEPVRDVARKDRRFDAMRSGERFKQLVPDVQAGLPARMPGF